MRARILAHLIAAVLMAVVLGIVITIGIGTGILPVQAATPAEPEVIACQVVNTFGAIEIARCEPENGEPYYVNSFGFMLSGE